jgi:spoIIIJ-associated protein
MTITDKVAAAKQIDEFLKMLISKGNFKLRYRIMVDPPVPPQSAEHPDILVDLSGPDSTLLLERGGEVLRSIEFLSWKMLRLEQEEHDKVSFDCMNFKAIRQNELIEAANIAAEKVRKTGTPFQFSPMSSRERRILHLALGNEADLKTESQGEGLHRSVTVLPKDYKPVAVKPFGRRR